jgi:hypothetical protein
MIIGVSHSDVALAIAASPAWKVSVVERAGRHPTESKYLIVLTNIGGAASAGEIGLVDSLPAGAVAFHTEGSEWGCSIMTGTVQCATGQSVAALGQSTTLIIYVNNGPPGNAIDTVKVSGGGVPVTATAKSSTVVGGPSSPFGLLDFSSQASDISGAPDVQAGGHPYSITTMLDLGEGQVAKAMEFELPAGLVGNPQVAPKCTIIDVFEQRCPTSSRVGTFLPNLAQGLFVNDRPFAVYNVIPERGYPAEFGFFAVGVNRPVLVYATVTPGPRYGLRLIIPDSPQPASVSDAIASFFGDPEGMDNPPGLVQNASVPFLTNPSDCSGAPLETRMRLYTWENQTVPVEPEPALAPAMANCDRLQFHPTLKVAPDRAHADEPTGYNLDLAVPQSQTEGLEGLATPDLKNATVTFPQGVSLSPGASDGLVGCPAEGPEGINLDSNEPGHCPLASQVGTAEAHTPLLEQPLTGHVYVALPGCGGENQAPCTEADAVNGTLFSLYLELEGSGVVIKQHGLASVNPVTGQLSATFREAPQQPFSDLKVTLKDGPRAPFANPQICGEALTTSNLTPWSSPQTPDATPGSGFEVGGCNGFPFNPTFEGGTTNTAGGAYTDFVTTLTRADREQDIGSLQVQAPSGLAAILSHVTLCGEPQAAQGLCPQASEIGTATVAAGAGSHPYWTTGKVYITGPYKGAPFGMSVVTPARAGPFDLGTVVTRATINVDPNTAVVTVTSDPLLQVLDGIPLRLKTVYVTLNKSQFVYNPTDCEAKQVTANVASAQGALAHLASPFAAGGCKNLPFDPGFAFASRSPASKKNGVPFEARVSSEFGQANIHSVMVKLPKQLPSRLTTIQQACPEATYAANPAACPSGSLVGSATATTPVLPVPLSGPAFLVSHGGAAFPDLDVILQGDGVRVNLVGSINIAHGITSSTFGSVPDAPITSFRLRLPAGPHSALTGGGSLCPKGGLVMPTTIVGWNSRRLVRSIKVGMGGCPRVRVKPKSRR